MNAGHELVEQVYAAKTDTEAADSLIRRYMGFIRAETAKYIHRAPVEGQDEELSIVLLAFYEAILGYEKNRGAFLSYASRGIRSRIIDYYRKEKKHAKVTSLHEPVQDDDNEIWKINQLENPENEIEKSHHTSATRDEIQEYEKKLQEFGISFSDVADNCPRQERTLQACRRVLSAARENPGLLDELLRTKKLPMAALSEISKTDKKTMERHRKYLVAVLLAFTNGYEIIRGHLYHLTGNRENSDT